MSKFIIILLAFFGISALFGLLKIQQIKTTPIVQTTTPQELSKEEYTKVRADLIKIVHQENPRAALTKLREQAKNNPAIARACHGIVHEMGHEAYEKYQDFGTAMQFQDEICNSGYLHGIIESQFATSQDMESTLQTVCSDYDAEKFIGWECYHGIGHGLMYFTENDLPKSLSLCETLKREGEQNACANGVFMENFNVDQKLHVSTYIKKDDPFYPCPEQKDAFQVYCYMYAPTYFLSLHKNDYQQALDLCKTVGGNFQSNCIQGVASQIMKENITNPQFVERICMQNDKETTQHCIYGMVELYINHFGRVDEARNLCPVLNNKAYCEEIITLREYLFQAS